MTTVAVLMPSRGRSAQLESRAGDLLQQEPPAGVRLMLVLAVCEDDTDSMAVAQRLLDVPRAARVHYLPRVREAGQDAVGGWNRAYFAARPFADWLVLGADDVIWRPGWLAAALAAAADGAQVVGLNDGHTNLNNYAPHYMVSRDFTERHMGGVMAPPHYRAWWFDREVCEKAQALGLYAPAWDAHALHYHPDWKTAPMDDTYRAAWGLHEADEALYMARRAAGFPVDYAGGDDACL